MSEGKVPTENFGNHDLLRARLEQHRRGSVLPVRLQATDPVLQWSESLNGGRGGPGGAEVRMPPRAPPPMGHMVEHRGPVTTRLVPEAECAGTSPMDRRFRALEEAIARLERENRELRGEPEPVPVVPVRVVHAPQPVRELTAEERHELEMEPVRRGLAQCQARPSPPVIPLSEFFRR